MLAQRLECDPVRDALDVDPALAHGGEPGDVELEHCVGLRDTRRPVRREGAWIEAAEVREPPRFLRRCRERQLPVARERYSSIQPTLPSATGSAGSSRPRTRAAAPS